MNKVKGKLNPPKVLLLGFATVILIGALLLTLPIATVDGKGLSFLNALFTSTSATCVTGLVVVDTANTFTMFGELVILSLIQVGGLGFMTFATFILLLLGKKITLKERLLLKESLDDTFNEELVRLVKLILIFTAILIFSNTARYEVAKRMNMISAGSYAYSESYELPYSETNVIKAIEKFKERNPKNKVPEVSISPNDLFLLEDSRSRNGLWFIAYLYDSNENRILNIAIRGNETNTTLEFASINKGLRIGNWKEINRDFSYDENQGLKNRFEEIYLNPIKKLLDSN